MYIPVEYDKVPLVVIENFLPNDFLKELINDIVKLKHHFGIPHWASPNSLVNDNVNMITDANKPISPLCIGEDIWLPFTDDKIQCDVEIGKYILNLQKYLFHQGILEFMSNCKSEQLNLYSIFRQHYRYHIINYGNGGYYNWHKDTQLSGRTFENIYVDKKTTFTFALTICKNIDLISGGDQIFMYKNNIVKLPLKHNQLVIFPSTVWHSCTEITAPEDLEWENKRFNIQAWLCNV